MRFVRAAALPVIAIAVWELVCRIGKISPAILPAPSVVARKWIEYLTSGELQRFVESWNGGGNPRASLGV